MVCFKDYKNLSKSQSMELLSIRNKEYIRTSSHNEEIIDIKSHLSWIEGIEFGTYFAIIYDNKIIGGASLKNGFWGIFYKNDINAVLKIFCAFVFLDFMFCKNEYIYSEVKLNNDSALSFNRFFGFKIKSKDDKKVTLKLDKCEFLKIKDKGKFPKVDMQVEFC